MIGHLICEVVELTLAGGAELAIREREDDRGPVAGDSCLLELLVVPPTPIQR